jgi:hypothetical protein
VAEGDLVVCAEGAKKMKNGLKAFDSDMHVDDHPELYTRYMNPRCGERIPVAEGWSKHGH